MPSTETLPPPTEHEASVGDIGNAALQGYVEQGLEEMDSYLAQEATTPMAEAGEEAAPAAGPIPDQPGLPEGETPAIRPEDAGRVHDIEKARAEALRENKIFEAHTEALLEKERREKNEAEDAEKALAPEAEAKNSQDVRQEAADALRAAGEQGSIPPGSQVSKDALGNIVIKSESDVKIIAQKAGGKRVTDYHYNQAAKTLTIKSGGRTVLAHVGSSSPTTSGEQPAHANHLVLPREVVTLIGTHQVTVDR
jgi:hypothetical protein